MSNKSTQKTADVSGDTQNAADINNERSSTVELHRQSEDMYTVYDREKMSVDSQEFQIDIWEHLYTPAEMQKLHEAFQKKVEEGGNEEEEGDAKQWSENTQEESEKDEEQEFNQLYLACDLRDKEAIRRLLRSSVDENELEANKNNIPQLYAIVKELLNTKTIVDPRNAFRQTSLHMASKNGHLGITHTLLKTNAANSDSCHDPLLIAPEMGCVEIVKSLIEYLGGINEEDENGDTALHLAARNDRNALVKILLNQSTKSEANSLLKLAESRVHPDELELSKQSNRNKVDVGHIPHHVGIQGGDFDIIKTELRRNSSVNADSTGQATPICGHLSVEQYEERDTRSGLELAANQVYPGEGELPQQSSRKKVDTGHVPHIVATQGSNFETSKCFSSNYSSMKVVSTCQTTPFHAQLTAGREHAKIVENLIFHEANVNACNNANMTPLHLACKYGHSSIVDILLDNHATVDATKQIRKTPFYLAAKNGHANVVNVLLRRGIYDSVSDNMKEGPLCIATRKHHTKVVEAILRHSCRISHILANDEQKFQGDANKLAETRGVIKTKFEKFDDRHVFVGIVWKEVDTSMETMLESEQRTALRLAVITIQPKMVKIFLSEGQCVYSEAHLIDCFCCLIDKTKTTPDNWYEVISKMKDRNIMGIMEFLCYDIHYSMECKNIKEIARLLLNSSKFNANYQDYEFNTLLHQIIKECQECSFLTEKPKSRRLMTKTIDDLLQLLLEKDADFNLKNAFGETALIIASRQGCSHAIQALFNWEQKSGSKLDLDARDHYGATALIKAAETYNVSVMRLLLSHKASVNLHDYNGFTALHAAVYDPNRNRFDLEFFCKELLERKHDYIDECREASGLQKYFWANEANLKLEKNLKYEEKTTRFKEEMVKLLLAIDELDVNAIDFRGNTPLDLAVKSSQRTTLETFKALEDHGAIRNSLESMDEVPVEVARVDERGRGPLHRLVISKMLRGAVNDMKTAERDKQDEWLAFMVHGFMLKPENFRKSANATDDKGRTPLHYAVMPSTEYVDSKNLLEVLLDMGSSVNATDMYGKTPLHYAQINHRSIYYKWDLLIKYRADIGKIDSCGHTPRDLIQLRKSVDIDTEDAKKLELAKSYFFGWPSEIDRALRADHQTELFKRKLVETVKIYSQSPRLEESSEEAIWKVWKPKFSLNRRLGRLKPAIQRFADRLADGIKKKDGRFECQSILVGSADEETKAVISGDFDFNFRLNKLSEVCDAFPHPLGSTGYFQLRRKSDNNKGRQSDGEFDCFFSLDHCLLTDEVNSRFQIVLEDVLEDPSFWQDEHFFERNLTAKGAYETREPVGLCKTVRLRMINPIEDGEGGFIFLNVSIDAVACVQMDLSCLGDQLALVPTENAAGCTLVFDRPRRPHSIFSDTFSRISFAPLESRIIRESSSVIKAAFIVCKLILYNHPKTTNQLKTSLLFCIEALRIPEGCERKDDVSFTPKELAFWVERLMFCFCEFYQHGVYPCYFMPSFTQRVLGVRYRSEHAVSLGRSVGCNYPFEYSAAFDIYLNLCPDDKAIDIPIINEQQMFLRLVEGSHTANQDPNLEEFNREGFIRKLQPRSTSNR